jgi:hypothetical protein
MIGGDMATIAVLQKKLKRLAKSLGGSKGGFGKGRTSSGDVSWEDKLDTIQEKLDETREQINKIITYVDKLVGKEYKSNI